MSVVGQQLHSPVLRLHRAGRCAFKVVAGVLLEELLKVRLAVNLPVQRGIRAGRDLVAADVTAEARLVQHKAVRRDPLHGVHNLGAGPAAVA